MPKGPAWTHSEKELLIENSESKNIVELEALLPRRSRKSIYRMIEKLRDRGLVGYKAGRTAPSSSKKKAGGTDKESDWGASAWE